MPDAVEPVGQDVHQEASDEIRRGQVHDLLTIAVLDAVVLPAKRHRVGVAVSDYTAKRRKSPNNSVTRRVLISAISSTGTSLVAISNA